MDAIEVAVLCAEIEDQAQVIARLYDTLDQRIAHWQANSPIIVESVAYQLHNLYNAIEDLLKLVATAFDNKITDTTRWHMELLRRMKLEIAGVRPALISPELYSLLNELRGFRHFFRHAYGIELTPEKVWQVVLQARALHPLLQRDVTHFVHRLRASMEA